MNLPKLNLYHVSTFVLFVSVIVAPCSGQAAPINTVQLVTSPAYISPACTPSLSVNCSFTKMPGVDFSLLNSLFLAKTDTVNGTVFREIASLSTIYNTTDKLDIRDDLGATVDGHFSANGDTIITYTWSQPNLTAAGNYRCVAYGVDRTGHPVVSTAVAEVKEGSGDVSKLLTQLHDMDVTQKDLQKQLTDAKTELAKVKNQLALTTQQLNQCSNSCLCPPAGGNNNNTNNQTQSPNLGSTTTQLPQTLITLGMNTTTLTPGQGTNTTGTTTQTPTTSTNTSLLTANQTFQGHNYGVSPPIPFNITEMQDYCKAQGGYLVEINTKDEYDMVVQLLAAHQVFSKVDAVMLGAGDQFSNDTFYFLHSGDPVTYFNWDVGEPQGGPLWECMGFVQGPKMHDITCYYNQPGIALCEGINTTQALPSQAGGGSGPTSATTTTQVSNQGGNQTVHTTQVSAISGSNQTVSTTTTPISNQGLNQTQTIGNLTTVVTPTTLQPATNQTTASPTTSTAAVNQTFRGHSYSLSAPMAANMTLMQDHCLAKGGYLVEIDDQQEYDYVAQLLASQQVFNGNPDVIVALGAQDIHSNDTFYFMHSGNPATYFNWDAGQPEGGTYGDCLGFIGRPKMHDIKCFFNRMPVQDIALCEIP